MPTWIHVRTSDRLPVKRLGESTPFEEYTEGTDPNDGGGFGTDQPTMYLPVVRDYTEPVFDPVSQKLVRFESVGVDGTYEGRYEVGPPEEWRQEWEVVARTLDEAKAYQLQQLQTDYQTRLDAGFLDDGPGASGKLFDLDEIHFGTVVHKKVWYDGALLRSVIPAGRKASVFASDSTRVQFQNFNKFNDFMDVYGLVFDDINEHYYVKGDDINAAGNVTQVGNVTWDFSVF